MSSNSPVALITGATGALGTAVTGLFRGAGFRVAGVARKWEDDATSDGLLQVRADLKSRAGAEFAVHSTLASFGRIDAMIHLAGGFRGGPHLEDTPDADWDLMLDLNLRSAVYMMRAVLKPMRSQGRGRIIVVGSKAAVEPTAGLSAYAASKAALLAVVKTTAAELKSSGITVNAVLPSTIDTAANREAMGDSQASKWVKPESIAAMMLWLCSDAGNDVTGACIPLYGRL